MQELQTERNRKKNDRDFSLLKITGKLSDGLMVKGMELAAVAAGFCFFIVEQVIFFIYYKNIIDIK